MDGLTRIAAYFPTRSLTVFWIMSNLIISGVSSCQKQQEQLLVAMLVIFSLVNILCCFTDSYTATNGQTYNVIVVPFGSPLCSNLPTDYDKDRVYEYYYCHVRDYIHALVSVGTFLLIIIFTNPIAMCLLPGEAAGTSRIDSAVVRTVPIVVSIIMVVVMMGLGPPRQMLGLQNVPDTCPLPSDRNMGDNPMYSKYPPPLDPSIPEGDEEDMDEEASMPPGPPRLSSARSRDGTGTRTPPQDPYQARRTPQASPR